MPEIDTVVEVWASRPGETCVRIPGYASPTWVSNSRLDLPHNPADGPQQRGGGATPPFVKASSPY